jgi:hypothetical protein
VIAEISRDGMLVILAESETERYALTRWHEAYSLGDSSPTPWGISIRHEAWHEQSHAQQKEQTE